MKWEQIRVDYPRLQPKFWSQCNWFHRFNWYTDRGGDNEGISQGRVCFKCKTWWDYDVRVSTYNAGVGAPQFGDMATIAYFDWYNGTVSKATTITADDRAALIGKLADALKIAYDMGRRPRLGK